ncbi:YpmS family protein [Sporosarcina sp. Marseille-Q4943]|uniref:YpmS family protein n=1 Tax=Sporosarcina sp. Marseille-Q4943 TaxID=2942204 RepID=UPI00208DAA07|nr:YpmS family protein [Sporosarcina sp. Marseille-Q4943]
MNLWKIAFFVLVGLLATGIIALIMFLESPGDSDPLPPLNQYTPKGSVLSVKATRSDLEALANNYIRKAMKGEKLPVIMEVKNDVRLHSELTAFGITFPLLMHFDPVVQEDGNLMLKQTSMEIAELELPPSAVLTVLRDSVKLPPWMIVRPKEEEIFIHLTDLEIAGNLQVRAKSVDLVNDNIELEVTIPND